MSIYGIGSDIVEINRIKKALRNKNFKKKYFLLVKLKLLKINLIRQQAMLKDLLPRRPFLKL